MTAETDVRAREAEVQIEEKRRLIDFNEGHVEGNSADRIASLEAEAVDNLARVENQESQIVVRDGVSFDNGQEPALPDDHAPLGIENVDNTVPDENKEPQIFISNYVRADEDQAYQPGDLSHDTTLLGPEPVENHAPGRNQDSQIGAQNDFDPRHALTESTDLVNTAYSVDPSDGTQKSVDFNYLSAGEDRESLTTLEPQPGVFRNNEIPKSIDNRQSTCEMNGSFGNVNCRSAGCTDSEITMTDVPLESFESSPDPDCAAGNNVRQDIAAIEENLPTCMGHEGEQDIAPIEEKVSARVAAEHEGGQVIAPINENMSTGVAAEHEGGQDIAPISENESACVPSEHEIGKDIAPTEENVSTNVAAKDEVGQHIAMMEENVSVCGRSAGHGIAPIEVNMSACVEAEPEVGQEIAPFEKNVSACVEAEPQVGQDITPFEENVSACVAADHEVGQDIVPIEEHESTCMVHAPKPESELENSNTKDIGNCISCPVSQAKPQAVAEESFVECDSCSTVVLIDVSLKAKPTHILVDSCENEQSVQYNNTNQRYGSDCENSDVMETKNFICPSVSDENLKATTGNCLVEFKTCFNGRENDQCVNLKSAHVFVDSKENEHPCMSNDSLECEMPNRDNGCSHVLSISSDNSAAKPRVDDSVLDGANVGEKSFEDETIPAVDSSDKVREDAALFNCEALNNSAMVAESNGNSDKETVCTESNIAFVSVDFEEKKHPQHDNITSKYESRDDSDSCVESISLYNLDAKCHLSDLKQDGSIVDVQSLEVGKFSDDAALCEALWNPALAAAESSETPVLEAVNIENGPDSDLSLNRNATHFIANSEESECSHRYKNTHQCEVYDGDDGCSLAVSSDNLGTKCRDDFGSNVGVNCSEVRHPAEVNKTKMPGDTSNLDDYEAVKDSVLADETSEDPVSNLDENEEVKDSVLADETSEDPVSNLDEYVAVKDPFLADETTEDPVTETVNLENCFIADSEESKHSHLYNNTNECEVSCGDDGCSQAVSLSSDKLDTKCYDDFRSNVEATCSEVRHPAKVSKTKMPGDTSSLDECETLKDSVLATETSGDPVTETVNLEIWGDRLNNVEGGKDPVTCLHTTDINAISSNGLSASTSEVSNASDIKSVGDRSTGVEGDCDNMTHQQAGIINEIHSNGLSTSSPEGFGGDTNALEGLNMDNEAQRSPFYFVFKVPKYEDAKHREQIKHAQLQVEEKTQHRDAFKVEMHKIRDICQVHGIDYEAAKSEVREARRLVRFKRQEIDSVQSMISRVKNAVSVEDIDIRICGMEHKIEHETLPLKEEKEFIRQIKQLKQIREQLSSNMGSQDEVQQALDQKDQIEARLRILKKELDGLKDKVSKAESAALACMRNYEHESKKLEELRAQFRAADDTRQAAYAHLQDLRKQLFDKNQHFRKYKDDLATASGLKADRASLYQLCSNQVETFMELWNHNNVFREEYKRCNLRNTVRRFGTMDGRSLGPDEEPPPLPTYMNEKNDGLISKSDKPIIVSEIRNLDQAKQALPSKNEVSIGKPIVQVAEEMNQTAKTKKYTGSVSANSTVDVSDGKEIEKPKMNGQLEATIDQEMEKKAEELRKKEAAEMLKQQRRKEEIVKAKEAQERKKRMAEKAQVRAEMRAQREAEQREKEREKRLRKKERKKASIAESQDSNNGEDLAVPESSSETTREPEVKDSAKVAAKKPQKAAQFTRQGKTKSVPPPLRNKGKRRMQQWIWITISAILVIALFLLGNIGFFSNLGQQNPRF